MSKVWSDLVTAIRGRGAAGGFDALVGPHLVSLYRLAYRFTGSSENAEDLVQALLLKLIPQEQKLRKIERLGPWLARSLYHLYVDQLRHRAISPLDLSADDGGEGLEELAEPVVPEEAVEQLLTQERVAAAVAQLPAEQRMLVAWHDIEGYTLEELAEQHHIPIGTLKSRLHRARARLRQILMQPFAASPRVRQ